MAARWIRLVTAIAVVWLSAEIVNLLWPRSVNSEWYLNWGSIIMTGVLGVLGGLICLRSFRPGSPAAQAAEASRARQAASVAPGMTDGDDT